jgi:hypothetical protein
MIKAIPPSKAARLEHDSCPALENSAVTYCVEAWKTALKESLANGKIEFYAGLDAAKAYRGAMPPLSGHRNICDFIACVGYALAVEIIPEDAGGKLLYSAQVALSAVRAQGKAEKNSTTPSSISSEPNENKHVTQ